ncbi:uncharacterized protein LOC143286815 isoform X2 [Babylonia areolata]|uniref:uncharacterized protein LOC143286815 isoform X2 n=1 Tax=Babylonia areolata TaxID=304850 RepID=UPI003FD2E047
MGLLQQFRLLLGKNLLLRWRHPGVLLLEVVWPVLIIAIVALIRVGVPPNERVSCHYQDRAMPSAGLVPFLQTFVCNLDNKCHSNQSKYSAEANAGSVSAMVQQITPYLSDESTLDMLDNVDLGISLISNLTTILEDEALVKELDNVTSLSRYFRDPDKVKRALVQDYGFSQDAVDALLDSQVNISAVLELAGYPDLKAVACDPERLALYLYFPEGTDVVRVSRVLCDMNESRIPEITRLLQDNLNVAEVIHLLGVFEDLKARLSQDYTWANGLRDVADMLDLVMSMDGMMQLVKELGSIQELPDILRSLPEWILALQSSHPTVIQPLEDLIASVDPLVSETFPNNSLWASLKDVALLASEFTNMIVGQGQAAPGDRNSSQLIMQKVVAVIRNVDEVFDGLDPELKVLLDSLSKVAWPRLLDLLMHSGGDNQTAVRLALEELQEALEPTELWTSVAPYLPVATDLLHSLNLMMHELMDARDNLVELMSDKGQLRTALQQLFSTGPNVTFAVLKAVTKPDVMARLLADGWNYPAICSDVMQAIGSDVGLSPASSLNATLCYGQVSESITDLLGQFDIHNITASLDRTIANLASAFSGNLTATGPVSIVAVYKESLLMMRNLERVANTTLNSWAELFSIRDDLWELMGGSSSREWEPVVDMLNVNYVGSSVVSLFGAAGRLMNDSESAQWMQKNLGPYVHMAASMMKGLYEQMDTMQATYSRESPMGQLVYYSTNYAPQIVTAFMDMPTNGNADMMYQLVSSSDPMSVLCGEHMLQHMGLPQEAALGMENAICLTNWTQVGENIVSVMTGYNTMVQKMMVMMASMNTSMPTSLELDWVDLNYYTSLVMDLMTSNQKAAATNEEMSALVMAGSMNQGPWTLGNYINYTQVWVAFDVMMDRMQNMTTDNLDFFVNIAGRVMEGIDQTMSATAPTSIENIGKVTQWKQVKHYFKIMDVVNTLIMDNYKQAMITSLSAMLASYPEEVRQMVHLAAGAYPELIDALKNIIMKPGQLVHKLEAEGDLAPNCGNVTVTSTWLMLAPDSYFGQLERRVCTANWTNIALRMASSPQSLAVQELIRWVEDLDSLQLDAVVNWTQTINATLQTLQASFNRLTSMEPDLSTFDLLPFNLTTINATWAQFYRDLSDVRNIDFMGWSTAMQSLQGMLTDDIMSQLPDSAMMIHILKANGYLSQHLINFLNIQLRYFNSTSEVDLFDMLGSEELRKVAEVLRRSPEINAIGVNTLIRIISNPSMTTTGMENLSSVCTNLTHFSQVVAVNDSIISTPLLQKTVCDLNINATLLLQQLKDNWNGFSDLVNAVETVMQPGAQLESNLTAVTLSQTEFSALLASVIQNPPTIKLVNESRWMDAILYEGPWKKLLEEMKQVYQSYQSPSAFVKNLKTVLYSLAAVPEMQPSLMIVDRMIDMLHMYLSPSGGIPTNFDGYPNMEKFYALLNQLPELLEMLAYTAARHPQQLNNWGGAMTSWTTFCSTDPTTLMTAPSGGGLDVRNVINQLCAIDFEELATEFSVYQGLDKLTKIMEGENVIEALNMTALAHKLDRLLEDFSDINATFTSMNFGVRFLNSSVWNAVFARLGQEFNQSMDPFMTTEMVLQMLMNTSNVFEEFKSLQFTMQQVLAATDVILDQVLRSLQVSGGNLHEMFSKYPSLRSALWLVDQLPEIYGTLAYTGLYTPEKLMEQFSQMRSFEAFCGSDITLLLTAPPQSGYNLSSWQHMLCSINFTQLLAELGDYQGTTAMTNIFTPNASLAVNVTSIAKKMERVMSEFDKAMSGGMSWGPEANNYFNITAWEGVMRHLQTWMQDASHLWSSPSFYKKLVSSSVLSSWQAVIPEMNTALTYTSAILDLFEQQLERSTTSLSASFSEYPHMSTMLSLLEDVPDIFEIFAFTTLQHQEQLARWSPAMASWETFCSYDPDSLLTAPPGGRVSVSSVLQRLCSLNVTELVVEMNQYQGMDRLQVVLSGNVTGMANATAVAEQMSGLIDSMATLFSTPMESSWNLRLFNETLWEQVFQRLGQNLNTTQQNFMSPATLMDFYDKLFAGFSQLNDTQQTLNKVWAVTDVVLDQMLRSFQGGSLEDMFSQYPTIKSVVGLLDHLPEIYETVMYTSLFTPDKVITRMEAFSSLETFCTTDMNTLFTVPDAVNFDLTAWQMQFCSLNLTVLMAELAQYQGSQDIANIFSPNSTVTVNVTSVVQKIETVLGKLMAMNESSATWQTIDARFLNTTLWEAAISNLEKWTSDPQALFWLQTDKVMLLYGSMMQAANGTEELAMFQPVYAVMSLLLDKLYLYENKTTMTLDELFIGAPEMQKLVRLVQLPGVIEVLLESLNSEKFAPLLKTNDVATTFEMLCVPTVSLDQYLTVPDGVTIDLSALKSQLCSINMQQLPQELMNFFDIDRFTAAVNGSLTVDYTALSQQYAGLSALIARWIESPPAITLPASWQNESFWLGILERYGSARQSTSTIMDELERFTGSLGPLMLDDPMRQVALVAQTVLRVMNENLAALQSQNLTLKNVVQRVPILQDVFSALGVEGDILDAMLKSPVKSAQMVVEALLADEATARDTICNTTRLQDVMQLPASFNSTALYQAVCLKNTSAAVHNLIQNLDLQSLIEGLSSPMTAANWSEVFQSSAELQTHLEKLIAHPPTFNASSLMTLLDSEFNTSRLWQVMSSFNYYLLFDLMDVYPELKLLENMARVQAALVGFLNDLVGKLVVEGATLDLASLFSSSPSFVRMMDAALRTKPDLLTAIVSLQISPVKVNELMNLFPANMQPLMCSAAQLEEFFMFPDNVNVTEVLDVLCTLNYTKIAEELSDNFMVEALIKSFAAAMNESGSLDVQKYITSAISLVERITNLTHVRDVTFNGNDLAHAFDINVTQFMQALEFVGARMETEYPELLSFSLNSVLSSLTDVSDQRSIMVALKALQLYLRSFNTMLEDISSGPISLAAIMNNTEVGSIVMPFLQNPQHLQDLLDLELRPHKLSSLLSSSDPLAALCGPQLFTAFVAPGNESAVLQHLQTSMCNVNTTVMTWQAIMGQANGYQLYLQMQALSSEVAAGSGASVNVSSINGDVRHLIDLVTQIVQQYQNGSRSADQLLDWRAFEAIFKRFSASLGERLMNLTQKWSVDLASGLLPVMPDDPMSTNVRTINTINIFMDIINDRLEHMIRNGVSLSSLLNNSATLVRLMEAYLDVTRLSPQGWLDNAFNITRVVEVAANMTMLTELCESSTLATYLADGSADTTLASAMQTVMCSVTTQLPSAFRQFIDYQALEIQLTAQWNMSMMVLPQYQQYADNVKRFNSLITQLATTPPTIDPQLASKFNFTNMLDALQNIATRPQMIFGLLKALGIVIDGPLSTNDQQNMFYGINTYVAQPLLTLVESLDQAGVSMSQVLQDPSKLLQALPVLMNFHVQFDVLVSTYLQPTMNKFWNDEYFRNDTLCNGQLPEDVSTSTGVDPSVVSQLCSVPTTEWIRTLKEHNYTEAQILSWVNKVDSAYMSMARCYTKLDPVSGQTETVCSSGNADLFDNKGMYWMRLMTTLEAVVTKLVPSGDQAGAPSESMVDPLIRMVDVLKDAFLNQTLDSAMNYLEAVDRMGVWSHDWLVFKQTMRFLQAAGNMLVSGLNRTTDASGTVHLQELLPDPEKLADLLGDILGPVSASEMLTASVNPQLFYQLSSVGQLQTVACDPTRFSAMFFFPPGTNVTAIQVSLCHAATERSSGIQELIDLFRAGDVLVQLDRLMRGNYSSAAQDMGLWQALRTTVTSMLTTFEQLQSGQFDLSVSESWLDPVLQKLSSLNQQSSNEMDAMCQSYVAMIGGTMGYKATEGSLVLIAKTMSVVTKAMPLMTKMDGLICAMTEGSHLDLVAGVNFLRQHGLESLLKSASDLMENGTRGKFQCSDLIDSSLAMSTWITNLTQSDPSSNMQQLGQCFQQGSYIFGDVLQGFSQLYQVMSDISTLLQDDDINALLKSSAELNKVINFIVTIMSEQKPVVLKFMDLLSNSTDVEEYLTGIMQLAPETVSALLESTVNLSASAFLNHSVSDIASILCDPKELVTVMQLPDFSPLNMSAVSTLLCTTDVEALAAVFKDAGKSAEFIAQLTGLIQDDPTKVFASSLAQDMVTLVSQLQSVSTLASLFGQGFDVKFLMDNADTIDAILAGGGTIQKIADSLTSLVGTMTYVVPEKYHNIITDIQTFIHGMLGLDLIQTYLAEAIHVSDLLQDPAEVREFLMNELNFSSDAASALLTSSYSIRVFLNASGLVANDEPCEESLPHFILLNATQQLKDEVITDFCTLNKTQLTEFMQFMVPELDIGTLIQKYISYSGEAFLDSLNMTKSEVEKVLKSLSDGSQKLEETAVHLLGDNSSFSALLSSVDQTSAQGEFDAMVALQPALCGLSTMDVSDQFNLNSKVQGTPTEKDLAEEAQLNGEFCKDLYRSLKSTTMGAVIWAYVKPIMLGKILFTPDTPLTRKIVSKANWVFDTLEEVKSVSKKWSKNVPSLVTLSGSSSDMESIKAAMSNSFVQSILRSAIGVDPSSITKGMESMSSSSSMNASSLKTLQRVAGLIHNYTTCLDLNRFEGLPTEQDLERRAFELYRNNTFLGGIVFLNMDDSGSQRRKRQAPTTTLPRHVQYKIRMDIDNVLTTNRIKDRLWMPYAKDDFANDLRYMRGFVQLQDMVEGALLKLQTNGAYKDTGVSMQQMPFPCHTEDDYIHYLGSYLLPILMTFAWLAAIGIATHNLVYDRQSGQEESLRIMGMVSGLNVLAWFLVTMLIMAIVAIVITIIFKFSGVFTNSNWFLLFLYFLDFCFSTTMMCYFISAFFSRVTLAILSVIIIYFISFLPYIILVSAEVYMTFWQKSLACLSSTTAFSFGAIFITRFEEETVGLQWDRVNSNMGDTVDFSWMCYMMLIDSAIYLVLGWYVRNVKPGKYGVKQPWYFPVLPSYWCSCLSRSSSVKPMPPRSADGGLFEPDPEGLDIGVSLRDLRKTFKGKHEVVRGVSVNIYHDQITTLLGHNGAAKTTTLNLLVGVLNPSSGEVLVEGKKTRGRTGLLGLCPQHNTLFEYMTVKEHMNFYGGVKGNLSSLNLEREIRKLLHDVDLWHVKDVPALHLSGGMQRRLCVALAFVGGSKTIVLDEPTSGVDPHARKNIWNLVMKNRPGRTILMSTHHLDEADMLSDRILIMHTGRLLSVGSPSYLKNQLGGGYKLTVNTNPALSLQNEMEASNNQETTEEMSGQHRKVLTFIQTALPSAKFVESVGSDLTVSVPAHTDGTDVLSQFFRQLDGQRVELGVLSYGISNTTLEEVFLKLTAEADSGHSNSGFDSNTIETESVSAGSDNTILGRSGARPTRSVKGGSLKFQQLGALLLKRVHHYRRNWRMLISTLLLPLLAFLCAMGFSTLRPTEDNMRNLIMTPALYAQNMPESYTFVQNNVFSSESHHFMDTLMADLPGIGTTCMEGFDAGEGFRCVTPGTLEESNKKEQECRCHDFDYQCSEGPQPEGVKQKLTHPDLTLQDLTYKDLGQYLLNSYYTYVDKRFGGWSLEPPKDNTSQVKVWFNNKGYHTIPSYFNALSNNLLRSTVGGQEAKDYGITLYNHPLMMNSQQLSRESIEASATDIGIAMVILLALSFIPSAFMVYVTNERVSQEKHLQSISGVGTFLYWSASLFWDMLVYTFSLVVMVIIVVIFKNDGFYDRNNLGAFALLVFLFGWAVIPLMYCTLRLFKSGSSAYLTLFCINMLLGLLPTICIFVLQLLNYDDDISQAEKVMRYIFLVFPQYALGIGMVDLVANQVQYELLKRFGEDTYVDPFDMKMLGWNFVALAIEGLFFFLLTFLIHSRKESAISMTGGMHYNASKDDEDVNAEQERVYAAESGDILAVKGLCKVYRRGMKRFCAVNSLSFGVNKGECFGLLGVNGAGKTTTFKMLTGASKPSEGDAILQQKLLSTLRSRLGDELGYCPQEDALDMYLSGRETLTFHAKLRGFGSEQVAALVSEQLRLLQLEGLADQAVRTYSGGNKRKLSLAVAMLGDPPLLLLDEPTTGMDAATRRLAWKSITLATQRGQSVLLTSHSMNECDSLCSRLAIMVNGQLKCIGSPQHLKNKFGDGYTVVMHLQGLSSSRIGVAETFLTYFPGSVIKDKHHSVVEVVVPRGAGSVADIFNAVRDAQAQHNILYYSVSQTTLDSVFVNFAREQTDDCEHDMDTDSSSGGSTSGSGDGNDGNFQKSMIGGTYAYMNPEYSADPMDSFDDSQRVSAIPPSSKVLAFDNQAYGDALVTKL